MTITIGHIIYPITKLLNDPKKILSLFHYWPELNLFPADDDGSTRQGFQFRRLRTNFSASWGVFSFKLVPEFAGSRIRGQDVFLDIAGMPDQVRVNTVAGSVTTRLASDVAAKYSINTVSGRLQLDDSEIRGVRGAYSGKYGTLEKHWLDFKANPVSGNISVLHAAVTV